MRKIVFRTVVKKAPTNENVDPVDWYESDASTADRFTQTFRITRRRRRRHGTWDVATNKVTATAPEVVAAEVLCGLISVAWADTFTATAFSDAEFHPGGWYVERPLKNYARRERSVRTAHLVGFTEQEEAAVHTSVFPPRGSEAAAS